MSSTSPVWPVISSLPWSCSSSPPASGVPCRRRRDSPYTSEERFLRSCQDTMAHPPLPADRDVDDQPQRHQEGERRLAHPLSRRSRRASTAVVAAPRVSVTGFEVRARVPLRSRSLLLSAFLTPTFALYGLFIFWPLVQVMWLALQRWDGYGPQTFIGLGNIASLASDSLFRT